MKAGSFEELGARPAPSELGVLAGLEWRGGQLDASTMRWALAHGYFPLPTAEGDLGWYSPDPRAVIDHGRLRRERSTVRCARAWRFSVDEAFDAVVAACAARDELWITDDYRAMYAELYRSGEAHSVEVWEDDELVGGLFGVAIGRLWSGESMFHRTRNASKAAMYALVDALSAAGCTWHDVQYLGEFTASLGATEIARADYLVRVGEAVAAPAMTLVLDGSG